MPIFQDIGKVPHRIKELKMPILQGIGRVPHRIKELRILFFRDLDKVLHRIKEMEVLVENTVIRSWNKIKTIIAEKQKNRRSPCSETPLWSHDPFRGSFCRRKNPLLLFLRQFIKCLLWHFYSFLYKLINSLVSSGISSRSSPTSMFLGCFR